MYPILYPANEKKFENNGLGIITDVEEISVVEELNGQFELEMTVPIQTCNRLNIEKRMFIFVDANETDQGQPFRIYEYDKADDYTMFIRAKHITFDTEKQFIESYKNDRVKTVEALNEILTRSEPKKPWIAWSDIDTETKVNLERQQTSDCIQGVRGSMLDSFGGEIKRDMYRFEFHKQRGRDNGVLIAFQKNMTGIDVKVDIDPVATRIFPYAQGENEGDIIKLPERFIDSPYINNYEDILIRVVEIQDVKTVEQLRNKAKSFFANNKIDIPKMSAKISFVPLQKVAGYEKYAVLERVALGDTVHCSHPDFPEVTAAKVIRTDYDPISEMYHSIEIGDAKFSLTGSQKGLEDKIKDDIENNKSEWRKIIDQVTDKITGNSGGHVFLHPKNNPSEIFVMDKDDINLAKQVLRINKEGIGFSKNGVNGPFETAWTVDGTFVADFIKSGRLNADLINVINLKADSIISGKLKARNDTFKIDLDRSAIDFYSVTNKISTTISQARASDGREISYWTIESTANKDAAISLGKRNPDGSVTQTIYVDGEFGDLYSFAPSAYWHATMNFKGTTIFEQPIEFRGAAARFDTDIKGKSWSLTNFTGMNGGARFAPNESGKGALGDSKNVWGEVYANGLNGVSLNGLKIEDIVNDSRYGRSRADAAFSFASDNRSRIDSVGTKLNGVESTANTANYQAQNNMRAIIALENWSKGAEAAIKELQAKVNK
ncbi:phage tail protein [Bacillus cereus]|uniref:phage tail spike protein n=1 Tax=Bacillus anthracis TaxID=1392 RepID=UPI002541F748|nr:phage tail spike protein [Bacillus anthracis]MDA1758189.1 phage tail protein [Bacillus cereus]MDA2038484.1 phage tail protein [Bacillus cereus]MDA2054995.1 phage tail protein [Bacillus cereus]MDA2124241.1 phage tail protein [Bacillus cereus]WIG19440.1 phage tail spike protein [Bacillus anthracis]